MNKIINILLISLAWIGVTAEATPWGLAKYADIATTEGIVSICIPANEKSDIAIQSVWVTESNLNNGIRQTMWDIELSPGGIPVTLRPGECVKYGEAPLGYSINTPKKSLEAGITYSARLNRFMKNPSRTDVLFYISAFCPSIHNGKLMYLQYKYEGGGTIKPQCTSDHDALEK